MNIFYSNLTPFRTLWLSSLLMATPRLLQDNRSKFPDSHLCLDLCYTTFGFTYQMKFFSIFNEIETTPTKVETVPKNHVGTAAAAMKLIRSVLSCTLDCDTGMVHDTIICQSHLNNLITFNAVLIRWLRNETEGDAFRSASQVQDWAKGIQNFAVALLHYKKTTT